MYRFEKSRVSEMDTCSSSHPLTFGQDEGTPDLYHAQVVEKLRNYVRLLGDSPAKKEPAVLRGSTKTYAISPSANYAKSR
jgi:hypothetical protein